MRQALAAHTSNRPFHFAVTPIALALAGLAGLSALPALAQQAATEPAAEADNTRIVVTGTRSPKLVDKIPGAITLVSKEDIQHTLAVTEDATAVLARTVPGYAEASQAMSNTGENLRGRIALRLFDGVPDRKSVV